MTLTQTVEIPENRRVHFDFEVPREVPTGRAQVEFKVIPFVKKEEQSSKPVPKEGNGIIRLTEALKEELLADETLLSLTGILHTDMSIEEIRNERLAKHL